MSGEIEFDLDGRGVSVPAGAGSLLDALREHLGVRSAKDGCSPQGQCGCCTVWIDGVPRVSCVTPLSRAAGRAVTTIDGLPDADRWAAAFTAAGASQCGFCTPGILMRLAALEPERLASTDHVRRALAAHLCRCTGWQTIVEAATSMVTPPVGSTAAREHHLDEPVGERVRRRAHLEGGIDQDLGPAVALGRGGFADDLAPAGALVALRDVTGGWVVAETVAEAREASGAIPGRRTTAAVRWPIEPATGQWARTLRTTWVEPAYLEPDCSWCEPGGNPASPLGNGGAFGGKVASEVGSVARRLADEHGRPVRVLSTRPDVVRHGPKRPPMAIAVTADGTGVVRVARTAGIAEVIHDAARRVGLDLEVIEVEVPGPPTSVKLRAAGWAEVSAVASSLMRGPEDRVTSPSGATAVARFDERGDVHVRVRCGVDPDDPFEHVIARSYCIGAAHMALGWVRSEALVVDDAGTPLDLTIRSFGILRATEMPVVHVEFECAPDDEPVNGSDAVFAAVAAAAWRHAGHLDAWPVERGSR